jgi:hypothetical protein
MSEDCKFWLDLGVNLLIALATFMAVVVALFGEWFKARFFPPRLRLSIVNPLGIKTPVHLTFRDADGVEHVKKKAGRYYHVQVENTALWPKATQVQICIVKVEEPGPDGQFMVTWTGEIPLTWEFQPLHGLMRDVGRTAKADLCAVVQDKWLQLRTMIEVLNFQSTRRKDDPLAIMNFIVTLEARSVETSSAPLRVKISWDRAWSDGDVEMQQHFTVQPQPAANE